MRDRIRRLLPERSKFSIDLLWNFVGLAVAGLGGVAINILIARYRGADTLGVFNQVFAFYIFVSQICTGGLHLSALKHVTYNHTDVKKCSEITSWALLLASALSIFICILAWRARQPLADLLQSPEVAYGLQYAIPGLLFFALNKVLLNVLNAFRHMRAFAVCSTVRILNILLVVIFIIASDIEGRVLPVSLTISEGLLFVGLLAYFRLRVFRFRLGSDGKEWIAEHIRFGSKGFLSGIFSEVNTRVDVLMLGYFSSDATVGIYSFAAILAEGFGQMSRIMKRNIDPIVGRLIAAGEKDEITKFAKQVRRTYYPILVGIGVTAVLLYPLILNLVVADAEFSKSWAVFSILMVGVVINGAYRPFRGVILLGNRPGVQTLFTGLIVLVNIIFNAILIPIIGIYGAAAATAGAFVLEAVLVVVFLSALFDIRI